jgi:hypothetical protein
MCAEPKSAYKKEGAGVYHPLSLGTIRPALRKIDAERSTATEIAIDIDDPEPLIRNERQ